MPACQECHRVKVRCDREQLANGSCSRCTRLEIRCVERTSQQGQRPNKKRARTNPQQSNTTGTNNSNSTVLSEDGYLLESFVKSTTTTTRTYATSTSYNNTNDFQFHYGIRYLIHSWTSFALSRRSFALMARACTLAAKCHVPMNDIFGATRRTVLDPLLYPNSSVSDNTPKEPPLDWDHIPTTLKRLCGFNDNSTLGLKDRYIMVRQAKNGQSRYWASDRFQQDVASVWLMEQAFQANQHPVVQLFLQGPADFDKFTNAIYYQMSRYTHPTKSPECVRVNGLQVVMQQPTKNNMSQPQQPTRQGTTVQEMDLIYAFEIVNLEHSFYVCEFVHPHRNDVSNSGDSSCDAVEPLGQQGKVEDKEGCDETNEMPENTLDDDTLQLFADLSPLEESDPDFQAFLALLND